eukprot:GHVQ01000547.1.p1 GENE.GHVQ01000547.1~~GHVQ01000547.1.p1  ORF type:complete len:118 (+),score=20.01 GHVQ01000547.1:193-546(+)
MSGHISTTREGQDVLDSENNGKVVVVIPATTTTTTTTTSSGTDRSRTSASPPPRKWRALSRVSNMVRRDTTATNSGRTSSPKRKSFFPQWRESKAASEQQPLAHAQLAPIHSSQQVW